MSSYPLKILLAAAVCLCLAPAAPAGAQTYRGTQGVDPETGFQFWQWDAEGVLFKLTQRLPDQTRGFFEARGFAPQYADTVAKSCVFQSMFKNTAAGGGASLDYDLNEWRVITAGGRYRVLAREHWSQEWSQRGVPESARIAFEWALLPTRQHYAPGDYNWGMTVYGLAPGQVFDLEFSWHRNGQHMVRTLEGIECTPDVQRDPKQ